MYILNSFFFLDNFRHLFDGMSMLNCLFFLHVLNIKFYHQSIMIVKTKDTGWMLMQIYILN